MGTCRSSDKAADKDRIISQWNSESSGFHIFVANINQMATGVNLHHQCSTGIFISWHLNAQQMEQGISRLVRIDQDKAVVWYLLKVGSSYHDEIERMCITKWAVQLSAEVALPSTLDDAIREICIYEAIRSCWRQDFNHYAWTVQHDLHQKTFDYHSNYSVRLGHIFSIVAKTVLVTKSIDVELWNKLDMHISSTCCALAELSTITTDRLKLALSNDSVRKEVWAVVKNMCDKAIADEESKQAEEDEKRAKLLEARRSRKVQKVPKSTQLIDDDTDSLGENLEEEDEPESPDDVTVMSERLERTNLTPNAPRTRTVKRIGRQEDDHDDEQSDDDEMMDDQTMDENVDMTAFTLQPTSLPDDAGADFETVSKKRKAGPEKDEVQKRAKTVDDGLIDGELNDDDFAVLKGGK